MNAKSMKKLKDHPFFDGIDFAKISQPGCTGARELVVGLVFKLQSEKREQLASKEAEKSGAAPSRIILKGSLLKENWYRHRQLRYIELYSNGELKYYEVAKSGKSEYKSSLWINSTT